jgi:hypothetical protein
LRVTVQVFATELTAFETVATNELVPLESCDDVKPRICVPETELPLSDQATEQLVPVVSAENVELPPVLARRAVAPDGEASEIAHG